MKIYIEDSQGKILAVHTELLSGNDCMLACFGQINTRLCASESNSPRKKDNMQSIKWYFFSRWGSRSSTIFSCKVMSVFGSVSVFPGLREPFRFSITHIHGGWCVTVSVAESRALSAWIALSYCYIAELRLKAFSIVSVKMRSLLRNSSFWTGSACKPNTNLFCISLFTFCPNLHLEANCPNSAKQQPT